MNELPHIHVSRLSYEGGKVWFRSLVSKPTDNEMEKWIRGYGKEARQRGPRNPLMIDVEGDKLRGV